MPGEQFSSAVLLDLARKAGDDLVATAMRTATLVPAGAQRSEIFQHAAHTLLALAAAELEGGAKLPRAIALGLTLANTMKAMRALTEDAIKNKKD